MQSALKQTIIRPAQIPCNHAKRHSMATSPSRLRSKPFSTLWRQQRSDHAVRSIPVTGPGGSYSEEPESVSAETTQISASLMVSMKEKIQKALETEQVEISDTYGDGRHVSIDVVSPLFEGQNSVKRQRMVYKAIWEELQETVHAVDAMTTKTPAEAAG